MKKIIVILVVMFSLNYISAQVIYLNTNDDDLYRLNILSCELDFVVHVSQNITDISFHPDGSFYGITYDGDLYEIDTLTGFSTFVHNFDDQNYNSLTIAADGLIYTTGVDGELWTYNKLTDQASYLGDFQYRATGDLTFYKGNLYVAVSNDRIVLIDLNDLSNSSVALDESISGEIFGIVSYTVGCDSINCYAISSGESDIYLINFQLNALQLVCELDIRAGGGASTYEFLGSSPLIFDSVSYSHPGCNIENGSITINISGGTPPILYSLDGMSFQSENTFDLLAAGNHTFVVRDANGCLYSKSVSLVNSDGPSILNLSTVSTSCGNNNGEVHVSVTNPSGPTEYSIDGMPFENASVFDSLSAGYHIVTIQDAAGCMDVDSIEIVAIEPVLIEDVEVVEPTCNELEGSITVETQSQIDIQFSIDQILFQDENFFENLSPGLYLVTSLDANGCMDTFSVQIDEPVSIGIEILQVNAGSCSNDDGSIEVTPDGGTGLIRYSINGSQFQTSNEFINLPPGLYTIEVMDEAGCTFMDSVEMMSIEDLQFENIVIQLPDCGENNGSLQIETSGGAGLVSMTVNGFTGSSNGSFLNLGVGEHQILLTDENGCTADSSVQLAILKCNIFVPNTFSPNGDGINDFFQIFTSINTNVLIKKYLIFDRWGNLVFEANDFPISKNEFWWDGTFKRISMSPGIYAFYIEVEDVDGVKESFKGNVTLVR